jgi:hypothetical protein
LSRFKENYCPSFIFSLISISVSASQDYRCALSFAWQGIWNVNRSKLKPKQQQPFKFHSQYLTCI